MTVTSTTDQNTNALSQTFSRVMTLNWETAVFIVILLLAIFTRFHLLGERVMSHDESLHTRFSYNLYADGDFDHTPLMHGPVLFHATAFAYAIFGDNDFSSRLYTAVLGVMLVMSPWLFRRWLGRWGAVLASIMLLISPLMMYYNRYIRHDTPSILFAVVMMWAILMYVNGPDNQRRRPWWLYIISAMMILNLGSKETAFIYIAIFGIFLALFWMVRVAQYLWKLPGKIIFNTTMVGILIGGVLSLGMYIILDIVQFDLFPETPEAAFSALAPGDQTTFVIWTMLALAVVLLSVIGTLFWAYRRKPERINFADLFIVIGMMLLVCGVLVVFEEVSHTQASSTEPVAPAVPGQEGETIALPSSISWMPMVATWLLAVFVSVFLVVTRRKHSDVDFDGKDKAGRGFWGTMDLFPEFDIIIVVGTLILPWATAIIPYAMKGSITDYTEIGQSLPVFIYNIIASIPGASSPDQVGQYWLGFLAWVPLMFVSTVVGLVWDWRRWLISAGIFYVIFAFFFTTVFTNMVGLGTGMVYSLGYWLEQQGVRRGSQPQYYYLLIIMPFYEFLPVVGGVLAMLAGLVKFWQWRGDYSELPDSTLLTAVDENGDPILVDSSLSDEESVADFASDGEYENLPVGSEPESVSEEATVALTKRQRQRLIASKYRQIIWSNPLYLLLTVAVIAGATFNLITLGNSSIFRVVISGATAVTAFVLALLAWQAWQRSVRETDEAIAEGNITPGQFKRTYSGDGSQPSLYDDGSGNFTQTRREAGQLREIPFLILVSWLGVLNLVGYSLAGEKMPWLGTHLTLPLILLTAWYFGRIIEKIDLKKFLESGWVLLIVLPLLFITLAQTIIPIFVGRGPFQGLSQIQLEQTYSWLASVGLSGVLIYVVAYIGVRLDFAHIRHMTAVTTFIVLSVITFRSAWMASFINYDYATEFLVYAHAAPAIKEVLNDIEELSFRITDGKDLKFAYDNSVSWPYSWYFRDYNNATFVGENPTVQNLEDAIVVVVGDDKRSKVEPILEDRYIAFDHQRLWWPMQEYFFLNAERVRNAFDLSPNNATSAQIREGMFDIWWARDYSTYGEATGKDFSEERWPVADTMYVYVRKDFARQIWEYGVGEGEIFTEDLSESVNMCRTNWQDTRTAIQVITGDVQPLTQPVGIDIAEDGTIFLAEEDAHRIAMFDPDGNFMATIGQFGNDTTQDGAFFFRPNSVGVTTDGNILVSDTWNFRIMEITASGEVLTSWGQRGEYGFQAVEDPQDGLWGPRDVKMGADGKVFIADTGNKRIRVYQIEDDKTVSHLYDIGTGGSGSGQLDEPAAVAVHSDGRVFVADTWNRRISVFNGIGGFEETYPVRAWYEDLGNRPYLALDEARDLLYVGDPDGGRVLVITLQTGDCVGAFGRLAGDSTADSSQFGTVAGIAVNADGFVYVVDSKLNRVLKFEPFEDYEIPAELTEEVLAEGDDVLPENGAIIQPVVEVTDEAGDPESEVTVELSGETTGQ